ncbi:MAG: hypothetical protein ABI047_12635 [Jatrophihabitantaceae bacterium]
MNLLDMPTKLNSCALSDRMRSGVSFSSGTGPLPDHTEVLCDQIKMYLAEPNERSDAARGTALPNFQLK